MRRTLGVLAALVLVGGLALWLGGGRWLVVQYARSVAEPVAQAPPSDISVVRDIVFAQTEDGPLLLDVYLPEPRPQGQLPVVVFVFGGGWFVGNKNQVRLPGAHLLTRRGYAVVATSYRLSDVATFPAQIHDVKATLRWVRANAERYGFDPMAVGAWGGSAGGHLVALLATTNGLQELEGDVGGAALRGYSSDVHAVVDNFGPTNFLRLDGRELDLEWMIEGFLGGPIAERHEIARLASPELHVSAEAAPLLIVHGDEDPVVPLEESTEFHARLQAAGADSSLHVVAGGGHGSGGEFETSAILKRVGEFFDRHLRPPPQR